MIAPPLRLAFVADAGHADVQKLTATLAVLGHELHLFSTMPPIGPIPGVRIVPIPRGRLPQAALYLAAVPWLHRQLRRLRPDLVHAYFATGAGTLAALASSGPLVVSAAGSDVLVSPQRSAAMRLLLRAIFVRARLVTTLAPHMTAAVAALGCPPEKVLTLPFLGIDLAAYPPRQPPGATVEIVCTRGLHRFYRHDVILWAMRRLRERLPQARLRFYGGGTWASELRDLTAALGLSDIVSFPGRLAPDEIPAMLASADLYVSMCPSDGVSSSLLEAMAAGTYPVVADIPANRWWIEGGRGGTLVPPGDATALADALHRAATDAPRRARAAAHNREIVRQRADLGQNVAQLVAAYHSMLRVERVKV